MPLTTFVDSSPRAPVGLLNFICLPLWTVERNLKMHLGFNWKKLGILILSGLGILILSHHRVFVLRSCGSQVRWSVYSFYMDLYLCAHDPAGWITAAIKRWLWFQKANHLGKREDSVWKIGWVKFWVVEDGIKSKNIMYNYHCNKHLDFKIIYEWYNPLVFFEKWDWFVQ